MVKYNTVNAKLSNLHLNKLKSAVKNKQGTTLRMNAKMLNRNNLPHELFLTTRQTTDKNAFDKKLSKAQISKIIQSCGFLGKILGPLLKTGLPLLKSVIKPLGLLGLTAARSAIDAGVQKKIYGSGTTTLVISSEEMNDIMKIVQALEDSNILLEALEDSNILLEGVNRKRKKNCKSRRMIFKGRRRNFKKSINASISFNKL